MYSGDKLVYLITKLNQSSTEEILGVGWRLNQALRKLWVPIATKNGKFMQLAEVLVHP